MMNVHEEFEEQEVLLSEQPVHLWRRRKQELLHWTERDKRTLSPKRTVIWNGVEVDAELVRSLSLLHEAGVQTEFSCAGVSPLDEPVDHSLYAYVTLIQSKAAEQFVNDAILRMRNRLLVTFEKGRGRYDLSSFFIGHNRSFCWWMERCALDFKRRNEAGKPDVL
ncbi:hypothetical protein [Paenibacillus polysaccharolyticus]